MTGRFALVLAALLVSPPALSARTWHITPDGLGDAPTIQAGIDLSAAGDTVALAAGTFLATGLSLRDGVVLRGPATQSEAATIDGGGLGRVLRCDDLVDTRTAIEHLTFVGGAADSGAAIGCFNSRVRVEMCQFENNVASRYGGAIHASEGSSIRITSCEFNANSARWGGAVSVRFPSERPTVTSCMFRQNEAHDGNGGALYSASLVGVLVTDCLFENNTAESGGAAMFSASTSGLAWIQDCRFLANQASELGGAIRGDGLREGLVIRDSEFSYNVGAHGGAVVTAGFMALSIGRCVMTGNQALTAGGAVYTNTSRVAIGHSTFVQNDAPLGSAMRINIEHVESTFELRGAILAFGLGSPPVRLVRDDAFDLPEITCTDIYGNEGGDWVDDIAPYIDFSGNLSEDPLFCQVDAQNYYLQWGSPCLRDNTQSGCPEIGRYGPGGCNSVTVTPDSWARVKARYR